MLKLLALAVGLVWLSGCGSEMKLAVKAADTEKDQPSAALVRKIELSYRDHAGVEKMRQSIAVTGMAQPVSIKSELLKELEPEDGGTFEARGYASDGLPILRGAKQYRADESDVVEVVMGREATQAASLASAVVRRLRISNVPALAEFSIDDRELRRAADGGGCVQVPPIAVPADGPSWPVLVVEGALKAPVLYFEAGNGSGAGRFEPWRTRSVMPLNDAANANLVLDRGFFSPAPASPGTRNFQLKLYSSQYEGCVEFKLGTILSAPMLAVGDGYAIGHRPVIDSGDEKSLAERLIALRVQNPNDRAITVVVSGSMLRLPGMTPVEIVQTAHGNSDLSEPFETSPSISRRIVIPARDSGWVNLHGFRYLSTEVQPNTGSRFYLYGNRGFQLRWSVRVEDAEGGLPAPLPEQNRVENY